MRPVVHFTDLEVWRKAHTLFLNLINHVDQFPNRKAANTIAYQMIRSCGSIGANIAEGFNRSKKHFLSYLDIAKGSCYETENWLYKARDAGYIQQNLANESIRSVIEINKMLHGLMRKISTK